MTHLQVLDLGGNDMKILLLVLGRLTHLRSLDLSQISWPRCPRPGRAD